MGKNGKGPGVCMKYIIHHISWWFFFFCFKKKNGVLQMAHSLYFEAQFLMANIETKWKSREAKEP